MVFRFRNIALPRKANARNAVQRYQEFGLLHHPKEVSSPFRYDYNLFFDMQVKDILIDTPKLVFVDLISPHKIQFGFTLFN